MGTLWEATRGTLLLVDDDAALTRALSRSLASLGWQVETASDGQGALERLNSQAFDVLVLDLQLPETDGVSLLEQIRQQGARPVAVLLSGHLDIPTTVRAVQAGAADVLEKPVSGSYLDERLLAALARALPPRRGDSPGNDAADRILGTTSAVQSVREEIRNVARFPELSVVIVGETGTGKELVAEAIHALSESGGPFVPVNCAAIPEALFESELFGHDAGAFTGAKGAHMGLLESAGQGTVFFDELGEMPPQLQPKLLRVLETRTFRRVGSTRDLPFRARVVSATNRRVNGSEGVVRSDLFFRLAGYTIMTPPLRERTSDIDALAQHFLRQFAERYPEAPSALTAHALDALHSYDWPGNVRELRAVVQQAAVRTNRPAIGVEEVAAVLRERRAEAEPTHSMASISQERPAAFPPVARAPLRVFERRMIESAWETCSHNLSAAARSLGLPRTTLRDKLRKYGLL